MTDLSALKGILALVLMGVTGFYAQAPDHADPTPYLIMGGVALLALVLVAVEEEDGEEDA